eukprot:GEMP01000135.1.p1 GENE.GEMP01000135.1~~GEMP01000135.1.p1  ORF type:complete len:2591 (+),score=521.30 GEMP01000135.1:34-7773(+)
MRKMQITCKRVRDKKQVEICNDEVQAPSIVKKTRTAVPVAPPISATFEETAEVRRPRDLRQVRKAACARGARIARNSLGDLSNANLERDAVCKRPSSDNAILHHGTSPRENTDSSPALKLTNGTQAQAVGLQVSPPVTASAPTSVPRPVAASAPTSVQKKKAPRTTVSTADHSSGAPTAERTSESTFGATAPAEVPTIVLSTEAPCIEGDAEAKTTASIVPVCAENAVSEGAVTVVTEDVDIAPSFSTPPVALSAKVKTAATAPKAKPTTIGKLKGVLQAKPKVHPVPLPASTAAASACATAIPAVASTVASTSKRKVQAKSKTWAPSVGPRLSLQIRGSRTSIDGPSSVRLAVEHPDVALAIELLESQEKPIDPDGAETAVTDNAQTARGGAETAREYQADRGRTTQVVIEKRARRASDPSSGRPTTRYPGRIISRAGSSSDRSIDRRRPDKSDSEVTRPKCTERSKFGQDTSAQEDDKTKDRESAPHKMRGWYSVQQAKNNVMKQKKKELEDEVAAKEHYEKLKKDNKRPPAKHTYTGWYSNKRARSNVIEAKKRQEEESQMAQRKKISIDEELKKLAVMTRAYKAPMPSMMKTDRPDPRDEQSPRLPFKPPSRSAVPGKRIAVGKFRSGVRSSPLTSARRWSQKRKQTPRQRQTHQPGQQKQSHQESQTTESKIEKPVYIRPASNRSRSMPPRCQLSDFSARAIDPLPVHHQHHLPTVSYDHSPVDMGPYQDMVVERNHRRALSLDIGLGRKCLAYRQKQCTRNLLDGIRHGVSSEHIASDTGHDWNEPLSYGPPFYHDSDYQLPDPYLAAHRGHDAAQIHPPPYEQQQPTSHHIPFPVIEHQRPASGGGRIMGGIGSIEPPAGAFQLSGSDYDSQVHEPHRSEILSVHAAATVIQKNVRRWISNRHFSQHWIEMQQQYLATRQQFEWPTGPHDMQHYHIPFPEESPTGHLYVPMPRWADIRREPQPADVGLHRMRNWDNQRPPSRGGESWQPLGQTSPPAYEQVTPEQFEQFQLICSPREASRHGSRDPPNEYNISVVNAVRRRENFPSPPSTPSLHAEVPVDDGNAFIQETSQDAISEQAEDNALWTPASQVESGNLNDFNDIEDRPLECTLPQSGGEESQFEDEDVVDADVIGDLDVADLDVAGDDSDAPSEHFEFEQAKKPTVEKTMSEAENERNEESDIQEGRNELDLSLNESKDSAGTPSDIMVAALDSREKIPAVPTNTVTSARSAKEDHAMSLWSSKKDLATPSGDEEVPACSRDFSIRREDPVVGGHHRFDDVELPKSPGALDMEFAESLQVLESAEQGLVMATDLQNLSILQQSQRQQMLINQAQQEEAKRELLLQNDLQMRAAMEEVEAQQRIVADSLVQGVYAAQTDMQVAHQSLMQKIGEQDFVTAQLQQEERVKLERQEQEYKEREEMLAKREEEMLKREREHHLREREAIEQAVIRREEQHRRREMLKTPIGWTADDNRAASVKEIPSAEEEDNAAQTAVQPSLTQYDARSNSDISIVSSSVPAEKMDVQLQQALGPGTHKTVRRLIPSLPSHRQDSAPSSARSPISSSDEKSNPSILAGDQFARFSNDLARRLAHDESRRGQMEEQLFAIQQRSVDENLTAQLHALQEQVRASGSNKTAKWMKRRVRKVTMQAEEQHKALEMKRQEAEMLSHSRQIMLQDLSSIISLKGTKLGAVKKKETPKELISPRVPDMDEATIDMRLHSLTQDMETCGLHEVKSKKEEALRLYRRKKQLISEKLNTDKLQREKDATKLLLDKALSLRIDEEVTKRQAADPVASARAKEPSMEDSAHGTSLDLDDSTQFHKSVRSVDIDPEMSAYQTGEFVTPCDPQQSNADGALAVDDDVRQDSIAEIDESFYQSTGAEESSFVMLLEHPVATTTADRSIDDVAGSSEIYESNFEASVEKSTLGISQRHRGDEAQDVIAQDLEVSILSVPVSESIHEGVLEASRETMGNQDSRSASSRAKVASAEEDSHSISEIRESMFDSAEYHKSLRSFADDKLPEIDCQVDVAVESHESDAKASIDDIVESMDDKRAETSPIDEPTGTYGDTAIVDNVVSEAVKSPYARMLESFGGTESSFAGVRPRSGKESSIVEQQSSSSSPRSAPKVASLPTDGATPLPALVGVVAQESQDDDDDDAYSMAFDGSVDDEIPEDLEIDEDLPTGPCDLDDIMVEKTDDASEWSGEKDPQDDAQMDLHEVDEWVGIEGGFSFFRNRSEQTEEICLADDDDETLMTSPLRPMEEICLADDDDEKLAISTPLSTPPSLQQPQSVPAASALLDLESILGEKDDEDKSKKPLSTIPRPPSPPPCTSGMSPVETEEMTDLVVQHVLDSLLTELWDDLEKTPLTTHPLPPESELVEELIDCSLESADLFLDHVMELFDIETEDTSLNVTKHSLDSVSMLAFFIVKQQTIPDPSLQQKQDLESWMLLLIDVYNDMLKNIPKMYTEKKTWTRWRTGFGVSPLQRYHESTCPVVTMRLVREKMIDHMATGNPRPEEFTANGVPFMNEEMLDVLLDKEIREEEKTWLDVQKDATWMKNQIAARIWDELVGQVAVDLLEMTED